MVFCAHLVSGKYMLTGKRYRDRVMVIGAQRKKGEICHPCYFSVWFCSEISLKFILHLIIIQTVIMYSMFISL